MSYEVYQKAQNLTADFQFDRAINLNFRVKFTRSNLSAAQI
ncbi:hypothetical protein CSUNSWCD_202 [Campylobacter showae CSUNSWCD]|uniref:Uncharacterized protein n=1 Tax=Campylobacter showae CSUNSWCD TaxID=1244083 RepID=M5II63_9BACT|nr:hypothetical protein CSUNSWCD_202 [Campylobacter showae CSUNSWCD]